MRSKDTATDASMRLELNDADQEALWEQKVDTPSPELKRPEGWTPEQYSAWLQGPRPEGWSEDAWKAFAEEQGPLNQ